MRTNVATRPSARHSVEALTSHGGYRALSFSFITPPTCHFLALQIVVTCLPQQCPYGADEPISFSRCHEQRCFSFRRKMSSIQCPLIKRDAHTTWQRPRHGRCGAEATPGTALQGQPSQPGRALGFHDCLQVLLSPSLIF